MEILTQVLPIVLAVLQGLGALVILSTIVVHLTPSPKDDELVGNLASWWLKIIHFLPTLGVNPQTQKLEDALNEQLGKNQVPPAQ